jgi:hypothetical protein
MQNAFTWVALKIKITVAAIKITRFTMDLDGEDFFPSFIVFLGRVRPLRVRAT